MKLNPQAKSMDYTQAGIGLGVFVSFFGTALWILHISPDFATDANGAPTVTPAMLFPLVFVLLGFPLAKPCGEAIRKPFVEGNQYG